MSQTTQTTPPVTTRELTDPQLYTNREISWLAFDQKVMETAADKTVPLLERLKFFSIFFNNLDEFYMVRVKNLQQQARRGITSTAADGLTAAQLLKQIREITQTMLEQAEVLWQDDLVPALEAAGIRLLDYKSLTPAEKKLADEYFENEVFPTLTPQSVDAGHPFPLISNTSINFVIELVGMHKSVLGLTRFARLKCPNNLPRFLYFGRQGNTATLSTRPTGERILCLESLIAARLERLFPGYAIKSSGLFRIIRNTDGEIEEDEADDLLAAVRDYVEQRRFGSVVRLQIEYGMSRRLQEFLIKNLNVTQTQIMRTKLPFSLSDFIQITGLDRPELCYPPAAPRLPTPFQADEDLFATLLERDLLLYHPYESFDGTVEFLQRAARDPNVVAIKQTLYRCGSNSPIIQALLDARRRGKQVTAVVELKARFDEERNINWAENLEAAGVNVVYGFPNLKIHAKLALVIRRGEKKLERFVHIGTGNYNASSAKIYTDLGLFTSDRKICNDVQELFNVMTGCGVVDKYSSLWVSPVTMRSSMIAAINAEIESHKAHGNGYIIFKLNQLVDPVVIQALYRASQAGVKIDCVIRGICCLRPGIKGVSETISVRSLVGRYLEHARVYCFNNNGKMKMYMGSADMMPRNLNGRIETVTPINDKALRERILHDILEPQLADNVNAWLLNPDGTYNRIQRKPDEAIYSSQDVIRDLLKD